MPLVGTPAVFTFDAIGTRWEIETPAPLSMTVREQVLRRIADFDLTYSRFRPDSLVSRIAHSAGGGTYTFPADSVALFDLYDRLVAVTGGAVDPLVGRRLEILGYDAAYSLVPRRDPEPASSRPLWARDGTTLVTRRPLVIDVGAAGKGYLVDLVVAMLREAGVTDLTVDAGGDLRHHGTGPLRVGLEHPGDPRRVIGVANLRDSALCASAPNRRAWGDGLHHLLDARTGEPVAGVAATWVVADDAATADGLATALFVSEPGTLASAFDFTYVRMLADGRAEHSGTFDGELFLAPG